MINKKSNDERIKGKLHVSIYAHPTAQCPNQNDPSTGMDAIVTGLDAAREWLRANGGYAALKANFDGPLISGWDVMRVYPGYGHRAAGMITPMSGEA
jgi:hypothetical protein